MSYLEVQLVRTHVLCGPHGLSGALPAGLDVLHISKSKISLMHWLLGKERCLQQAFKRSKSAASDHTSAPVSLLSVLFCCAI